MTGTMAKWLRSQAVDAAVEFGGVLSRRRLRELGIDRNRVAREIASERWRAHGAQTVAVHTGELSVLARRWRAVWEVGCGAVLDGVSALQVAGLENFDEERLHVSVAHSLVPEAVSGVRIHRIREPIDSDTSCGGVPRVRAAVAAVRAAQWAVSDRQAALVVCMSVQQGVVRGTDLCDVRHPGAHYGRTAFVRQLIDDVTDGAHSLGELDFARLCRERGLPEPERQVMRTGSRGRVYLDVRWRGIPLVVEIDGAQHRQGLQVTSDNLRRNDLAIAKEVVLTIDLVGLRLETDAFLAQVMTAYRLLSRRAA